MKKVIFGFVVITALTGALVFEGCGQNGPSTSQSVRSGRGANGVNATGIPGALGSPQNPNMPTSPQQVLSLGWGTVNPTGSMATRYFLSTNFTVTQVGYTANDNGPCVTGPAFGSAPCGILFTVTSQPNAAQYSPLTLQGGSLSSMYGSAGAPLSMGYLTMVIWDSMSGTQAPDGTTYTPIPVVIPLLNQTSMATAPIPDSYGYSMYNGGGNLNLVFGDSDGYVQFTGTTNGTQFTGTVNFSNAIDVNTGQSPGQNGSLGNFTISICQIVQC